MAEAFDRTRVRCVLPERSVSSRVIIIGGEFRQNSPQMLFVDHDQMIGTLAPDRPDQAFDTSVLPGCAERGGPIPDAYRPDAGLEYAAECLVMPDDWALPMQEILLHTACELQFALRDINGRSDPNLFDPTGWNIKVTLNP